ncbi:MAG: ATP-binding protein [Myxococcota bacterium]
MAAAQRRLAEREAADRGAAEALCAHDLLVAQVLGELAGERFGQAEERRLARQLPALMRSRRFDTLHLVDARSGARRGRILGAGHYPGLAGGADPGLLDALGRAGDAPFVTRLRVRSDEGARDARVLVTGCTVARDRAALAVLVGRRLEEGFADGLLGDVSPVHFALVEPGEAPPELRGSQPPREVGALVDAAGARRLVLLANIDDAPLRAQIAALERRGLALAGVALVLALVFAVAVAYGLSRGLRELEAAARRVGAGDLDSTLTLPRRRTEVGRTAEAFNAMTRELAATQRKLLRAERIAAWREVARRIAHEIKNPLQPIQIEIETMRKLHARKHPSFDAEFESSTGVILEEVQRLNAMVTEFSRFARLPAPTATRFDLRELATHVGTLHPRLEVSVPDAPLEARADRDQLTQVLVNLVQNGADAAEARHGAGRGTVRLSMAPASLVAAPAVELRIEDDGPGIALEDRLRIFEPYFTTKSQGTGLGLAIVHRIVGDHGGSIDVADAAGGGAAFVVLLPESGPPAALSATLSEAELPLSTRRE